MQKTGLLSWQVQLQDRTVWRRHWDHVQNCFKSEEVTTPLETVSQEKLWESTPNSTHSSLEDRQTSEQKLEETLSAVTGSVVTSWANGYIVLIKYS